MNILAFLVLCVRELRLDLEGMRAKVITLRLEQVGGQVLGTVSIKPGQSGGECWGRYTEESSLGDDVAPAGLRLVDCLVEKVVEEEVFEIGVGTVRGGDVLEEDGADDAATTPHEGDRGLVELPAIFLGSLQLVIHLCFIGGGDKYLLHEHESLGVRDDLGCVQSLLEILKELLLIALELVASADE